MSRSSGHQARICLRCGMRADARRGPSAVCLSCGQPFPVGPPGGQAPYPGQGPTPRAKSSAGFWVLGLLSGIGVLGIAGVALVVSARGDDDAQGAPLADSPAPGATDTPSATAAGSTSAKPAGPLTDEEKDELAGNYTCSMDDTPAFPCRISSSILEKLGGSQRFKGPVTKLPGGNIAFSGTFFCPFGDCTHPVSTTFVRQGPGRYVGKFGANTVPGGGPGGERVVLVKVR